MRLSVKSQLKIAVCEGNHSPNFFAGLRPAPRLGSAPDPPLSHPPSCKLTLSKLGVIMYPSPREVRPCAVAEVRSQVPGSAPPESGGGGYSAGKGVVNCGQVPEVPGSEGGAEPRRTEPCRGSGVVELLSSSVVVSV